MKYRKRPVIIEAFQFTNEVAIAALIDNQPLPFPELHATGSYHPADRKINNACIGISTLEGAMRADLGDWIIRGIKGELYPCKPDIFAATYEAVEPAPNSSNA